MSAFGRWALGAGMRPRRSHFSFLAGRAHLFRGKALGQLADEEPHVGDDPHRLERAPVHELGNCRLVDVDAHEGTDAGRQFPVAIPWSIVPTTMQ